MNFEGIKADAVSIWKTGQRASTAAQGPQMWPAQTVFVRQPLTASQHILHLLLTVFTAGLWAPIWIARAVSGNRVPAPPHR